MNCTKCDSEKTVVTDTRPAVSLVARRRRCVKCQEVFYSLELPSLFVKMMIGLFPRSEDAVKLQSELVESLKRGNLNALIPYRKGRVQKPVSIPRPTRVSKKPVDRTWFLSEEEKRRREIL